MSESSDPIRVLHVDDEPGFAEVASEFLEREDGKLVVETATSAEYGIEHIADNAVDCIVSDYDMPGDNGIEFLERVRGIDQELPFILFTGKGSEEIASDAISAGVTDYLQKESATSQYAVLANRIRNAVEQHRTKRAVEASQKRLSLFIEQSPLGVLEYDEDFEIVRINERAEEILGYSEAELRGHTWERLVTEDSYDDVDSVTDELAEGAGGYHSIDENVRKDGERIVCEWHNRIVTDDDGDVVAIFSQFQDVTERREREEQLQRTSARLEALFENSPDGINIHDIEGTILEVNPQLCEMTGYDESELVGMKVWEVDEAVDPETARDIWCEMAVGDRETFERQYRRRDGSEFPVEVHVRRLSLDGNARFVASSREIENTIQQRQRVLREIYDAVSDIDRTFERKVEALIDIGRRVVGTEYGSLSRIDGDSYTFEVIKGPDETVEPGEVVELGATNCERTASAERTVVLADIAEDAPELTDREGYTEWGISCYVGTPIFVDGELYGTFCFYDTERREEPFSEWEVTVVDLMGKWISYELHRRRTERRLRTQNERLEQFTNVVSHDLRNPLGVANGNLELARMECDSDRLDAVGDALGRMETLIENLLELAREGETVTDPETVDLGEAVGRYWRNVETAGAELVVDIDRTVEADPSRLGQLFENLFRNAAEHGGSDVMVTVGDLGEGFYVADDGPGIDPDDRERIFEAGYSDAESGTGFGLAIVERVAEAHGWRVRATAEGGGTHFEITGVGPER